MSPRSLPLQKRTLKKSSITSPKFSPISATTTAMGTLGVMHLGMAGVVSFSADRPQHPPPLPAALVCRGSSTSSLPARESVLTKEEGMNDRTEADKAWEARQEAARYRIFNAATNAAEATDEADDEKYFAVLDQAGNAAEAAAAEITGYKTYADLLEALDTRRKQSQGDEYGERRLHR